MARSRSASSITIIALLPPSSSRDRPKRLATAVPTFSPMLQDPVAEMSGSLRSLIIVSPTSRPLPAARLNTPSNPVRLISSAAMLVTATAVSGVWLDGFQMFVSPHTAAMKEFQLHTATGKLNDVMMPIGPSGCHCSYMRWRGRSDAIVKPYSWRERPTAKSATSIISWTSPSPSAWIFPISRATSAPSGSLYSRSASPNRRMYSPRLGAGSIRHSMKVSCESATTTS